ncbi:MAG: PAS domain-containing sensor histidine kinase [Candidatus Acidiferrales bacterium]
MARATRKLGSPKPAALPKFPRSDRELDLFFRLSRDLLAIADFDGYFKRVNPAWEQTLGWTTQELLSRPYLDFVHPEDRESTLAEAAKLTTGAITITFENRYRCKDGSYRWLQWNSTPLTERGLIYADARDITHLKQAEEKLQRYAAEVSDLYNNAPCGYHSLDPQGVFLRINDTELKWLGYKREEIVGRKRFPNLLTPESLPLFDEAFAGFKRRGWVRDLEFELVRKDRTRLPIVINATAVYNDAGEYIMSRSTIFDNTDRKALERMKDEFISMVGHELRTPLTSMRTALGLLASGRVGNSPEKTQQMLTIALEETDRLTRLVSDMLDLQRLELGRFRLHLQSCDAAHLVHQVADAHQPVAEKAGLRLEVSAQPVALRADPDRIVQVLTNLLNNAVKFAPAGTALRVSCEQRDADAVFRVTDEGSGIASDACEGIFERFRQADAGARTRGGMGLGLYICRGIVQQHGGRIGVESAPGKGSTFWFTLPARKEESA